MAVAERNALVEQYRPLTFRVVRDNLHVGSVGRMGVDDAGQSAAVALVRAAELYRPGEGVPFVLFAYKHLRFVLLRVSRAEGYLVRIPEDAWRKHLREQNPDVERAIRAGTRPTLEWLVDPASDPARDDRPGAEEVLAALSELTEREAVVVRECVWRGRTASDVARQLRVSHQAVGETRRRALAKLRVRFGWTAEGAR